MCIPDSSTHFQFLTLNAKQTTVCQIPSNVIETPTEHRIKGFKINIFNSSVHENASLCEALPILHPTSPKKSL